MSTEKRIGQVGDYAIVTEMVNGKTVISIKKGDKLIETNIANPVAARIKASAIVKEQLKLRKK